MDGSRNGERKTGWRMEGWPEIEAVGLTFCPYVVKNAYWSVFVDFCRLPVILSIFWPNTEILQTHHMM